MTNATDCDFMARVTMDPHTEFFANPEATADLWGYTSVSAHDTYDEINFEKRADLRQDGKVVVITGARGVARGMAIMFARAGAKAIAIGARTESQLEETKALVSEANPKTEVLISNLDVTSDQSVKSFYETITNNFGTIDVVISNAGMMSVNTTIAGTDTDDFWRHFEVNTKGTYLMAKYYLQALDGRVGTFISVSSNNALTALPLLTAYTSSKFGAMRLLECIHLESPNLRVVAMHPGYVLTEMSSPSAEALNIGWAEDPPELYGGIGLYLTSPRADFLRGRWIHANWRVDELEARKDEIIDQNLLKSAFNAQLGKGLYPPKTSNMSVNIAGGV